MLQPTFGSTLTAGIHKGGAASTWIFTVIDPPMKPPSKPSPGIGNRLARTSLATALLAVRLGATVRIALAAGAWGLHRWAPFADEAAAAPKVTWPKNVQPVVDFVQDATQQQFLTPVKVEFIADTKKYNERVDSPPPARTQSDVDDAAVGASSRMSSCTGSLSSRAKRCAFSPSASLPIAPMKQVFTPWRWHATAWLKPLPPGPGRKSPTTVSPRLRVVQRADESSFKVDAEGVGGEESAKNLRVLAGQTCFEVSVDMNAPDTAAANPSELYVLEIFAGADGG